jgi:hypothetical protein
MLVNLLRKQMVKLSSVPEPLRGMRALRYLIGRGFEPDLVRAGDGAGGGLIPQHRAPLTFAACLPKAVRSKPPSQRWRP